MHKSSYGAINQQQRLLGSNTFPQQTQVPLEPISPPLIQRMLLSIIFH
jgi:hypothetical protein